MTGFTLQDFLSPDDPLVVIDGGARNGPKHLAGLESLCQYHCFEPNPSELAAVDWSIVDHVPPATNLPGTTAYPFALCGESGTTTLNVSARPGATSTLEPNRELLDRFAPDNFSQMKEIVERVEVPSISMDDFLATAEIEHVDFLKLDTQGNELDILRSAGDYLDNVFVIMTEVELLPMYEGQPLFHDVSQFLCDRGFELVDLKSTPSCRRFHARPDLPPFAYRLVWGDAVFARRPQDADKPRALQQALVLAALGYADMAIDLFERNPELDVPQVAELERFARWGAEPHSPMGRLKRVVERAFGLIVHRYPWRRGHQVGSVLAPGPN